MLYISLPDLVDHSWWVRSRSTVHNPPTNTQPHHQHQQEKDTYYLVNKVKNPALQRQLNAYGRDVGYRGFVMVVLGLLFCSAASK